MNAHRYEQLQQALDAMGNTHSFEDILASIESGHMQSFAEGETWCVTQIIDMPRKRVLEIVLLVGTMEDAEKLHDQVMNFAIESGCQLVRTFARDGWRRKAREYGWKNGYSVFLMEV